MITENDQFHPNTRSLQSKNLFLRVMSLGATVLELRYRGRPVVLSYPAPDDYLRHTAYLGAVVGRVANRIGDGRTTALDAAAAAVIALTRAWPRTVTLSGIRQTQEGGMLVATARLATSFTLTPKEE